MAVYYKTLHDTAHAFNIETSASGRELYDVCDSEVFDWGLEHQARDDVRGYQVDLVYYTSKEPDEE